jgi:hypothetical protein
MTMTIKIGSRVRSFDFDSRDLTGDYACYVEGVVTAMPDIEGCTRYEILVDRVVFGGKETLISRDHWVTPPVNGTPKFFDDDVCNGVELITDNEGTRCQS